MGMGMAVTMDTITTMGIITTVMVEVGAGAMESESVWGWACWVTASVLMPVAPHIPPHIRLLTVILQRDMRLSSRFLLLRLSISSKGSCKCRHRLRPQTTGIIAGIRKATILT